MIIAALPQNANRSVVISKDGGMTWSTFDEGITWPGQELPYYLCLVTNKVYFSLSMNVVLFRSKTQKIAKCFLVE